jgi:hypothetical protein
MSWIDDGSIWKRADMWATPTETSEYVVRLYRRACAHGDQTIDQLDLDTPGRRSRFVRRRDRVGQVRGQDPGRGRRLPATWGRMT